MDRKSRFLCILLCIALTAISTFLFADVMQEAESKVKIEGMLGKAVKLFGGSKPVRTVQYFKGDFSRTDNLDKKGRVKQSSIIDLKNERFITLNHKKKKAKILTFEEWKEMLTSGLRGLTMQPQEEPDSEESQEPKAEVEWSFSVDIKEIDENKNFAGHPSSRVDLNMKMEADITTETEDKGTQKAKGGLIIESTNWVNKSLTGPKEMREFQEKLLRKLDMDPGQGGLAGLLANVMKNNEQLAAAIEQMREEGDKLEGVILSNHTVFKSWGQSEQAMKKDENQENEIPKSVGGMFKKFGRKKKKGNKDGPKVMLETFSTVKRHDTSTLNEDLFRIPENYKIEEKKK